METDVQRRERALRNLGPKHTLTFFREKTQQSESKAPENSHGTMGSVVSHGERDPQNTGPTTPLCLELFWSQAPLIKS